MTYIVCAGAGLDVGGEAIPYVAGWGEGDAAAAVTRFAETIDQIARHIEAAIEPKENKSDGQPADEARMA